MGYNPKYIAVLRTPRSVQALSGKQKKRQQLWGHLYKKTPIVLLMEELLREKEYLYLEDEAPIWIKDHR